MIGRLRWVLFLSLVFTLATRLEAQDLNKAKSLENQGKPAQALKEYKAWLDQNGDSSNYATVALQAAGLETDIHGKIELLSGAIAKTTDPATLHDIYVSMAKTEEIANMPSEAQKHYQDASFAIPGQKDFDSLLSSALLALEIGDFKTSEAQAKAIIQTCKDQRLVDEATVLLSRVDFYTGKNDAAISLVRSEALWKQDSFPPDGLLWIYKLAGKLDLPDLKAAVLSQLASRYPDSPEYSLATGSASYVVSPSSFIAPAAGGSGQSAAADSPATGTSAGTSQAVGAQSKPISIQTGSFTVRENAQYAAKDLQDAGFKAEIIERVVDGTTYYRVVVPNVDPKNVDTFLLKLKEKGFEGFPLY